MSRTSSARRIQPNKMRAVRRAASAYQGAGRARHQQRTGKPADAL
ncbi:hypothetical protein [Streptosporangium sp. NPDC051022]